MSNLINLYNKYKEYILYIIFGVATTVVNFVIFFIMIGLNVNIIISNTIAFIGAVVFAYITNSRYVFKGNRQAKLRDKAVELFKFFSTRIATFFIESILLYIMVSMQVIPMISKFVIAIIVVILNYILSKLLVFNR